MGVDVAGGGGDVAVTQPLLNILHSDTVRIEQAGAGMPQIVESDFLHLVAFQNQWKMLSQKTRRDQLRNYNKIN